MPLTRTSIFSMCTSWTCKEWRKDSDSLCHPKSTSTSNSQAKAFDAMAVRAIKQRSRHTASEERRADIPSAHPTPMERKERGTSDSFQSDATHFFSASNHLRIFSREKFLKTSPPVIHLLSFNFFSTSARISPLIRIVQSNSRCSL